MSYLELICKLKKKLIDYYDQVKSDIDIDAVLGARTAVYTK